METHLEERPIQVIYRTFHRHLFYIRNYVMEEQIQDEVEFKTNYLKILGSECINHISHSDRDKIALERLDAMFRNGFRAVFEKRENNRLYFRVAGTN